MLQSLCLADGLILMEQFGSPAINVSSDLMHTYGKKTLLDLCWPDSISVI